MAADKIKQHWTIGGSQFSTVELNPTKIKELTRSKMTCVLDLGKAHLGGPRYHRHYELCTY